MLWRALLALLGCWAVFSLIQTVQYVLTDYSQIPVFDYWRIPQLWANHTAIHWSNLWEQHNEHRIIFPELIDVTDMLVLHGRMYLPIAVSGLCYLGIWAVLAFTVLSQKVMRTPYMQAGLLLAAVMIFWKGCSTVIATPFQLPFTMLQVFSALALLFLSLLTETKRKRYLAGVIAAGVVCTYTSANGMLMWVILIAAGLFLRLGWRPLAVLCGSAAVFAGAYFFHYRFLPSPMSTNIRHPLQAAEFLCSFFSMPFGCYGPRSYGFAAGALNLMLMGGCFVIAGRRGVLRTRVAIVVFGSYVLILMSALLTTAGRMDLNDYQFGQAKAWRYVTMPTVSWALLCIAVVWVTASFYSRVWSVAAVAGLSIWFSVGFRKAADWVDGTRLDLENGQITATMLRNGVFDPTQVQTVFPNTEFVRRYLPSLSEFHESIYIHGPDKWIGSDLGSLPLQKAAVPGKITRVVPVPGGVEVFGWADSTSITDDHDVLFVNGENRVVGFARRPAAGLPPNLFTWDTPNQLAFVGYVSLARPVKNIKAYVITFHGKQVQPLGSAVAIPAFTQMEGRSDTAVLPGITWLPEANWSVGGYNLDAENGPAPPNTIYGSWSGSDEKTGAIRTAPFAAPANHCLVLPVLQGRSAYGQSVEVRDADSMQVIAEIPFLDGRTIWQRWRIPVPASTHNLAIVADDEGEGQNQWLAVAAPEQCP
jgi:hypothetical protein